MNLKTEFYRNFERHSITRFWSLTAREKAVTILLEQEQKKKITITIMNQIETEDHLDLISCFSLKVYNPYLPDGEDPSEPPLLPVVVVPLEVTAPATTPTMA